MTLSFPNYDITEATYTGLPGILVSIALYSMAENSPGRDYILDSFGAKYETVN
jgi:hypothetical protein